VARILRGLNMLNKVKFTRKVNAEVYLDARDWQLYSSMDGVEEAAQKLNIALQEAIGKGYSDHFCEGGFFWGHQFQEEAVQEYKDEDTRFVTAALEAVREGKPVVYSCWY